MSVYKIFKTVQQPYTFYTHETSRLYWISILTQNYGNVYPENQLWKVDLSYHSLESICSIASYCFNISEHAFVHT